MPMMGFPNLAALKAGAGEEKKRNPKWERKMTRIFGEAKAARV